MMPSERTVPVSERDLPEVIAERLPYNGPHSAETVTDAAQAVSALVRYLTNATRTRAALPDAATVDDVLGSVESAVYGLDQLCGQLADELARQRAGGVLFDDRRPAVDSLDTASEAVRALTEARATSRQLVEALAAARHRTTHLGTDLGQD
jgi:hypothetical protein